MRTTLRASLAAILVVVHAPRPARACSDLDGTPHQLDPAFADDTTPPNLSLTGDATIQRRENTGCANDSCGDGRSAWIDVPLLVTDDRAPLDRMGWEVTLRSGILPHGLFLPPAPMSPIDLRFDPDAHGFDVTLEIRAVDLNGRRVPPGRQRPRRAGPARVAAAAAVGTPGASAVDYVELHPRR